MLTKIIRWVGQPTCAVLYALGAVRAVKNKKFGLLCFMFFAHLAEYFVIGAETGKAYGIKPLKAFLSCLAFGFTWWLPIRMENKTEEAEA